jgi:hypothetical protein
LEGYGGCNPDIRCAFNIGRGTVEIYKRRVVTAIRQQLCLQAMQWPNAEERKRIAQRIEDNFILPNCVGFIDGTLFPLAFTPSSHNAPDYFGRKGNCALSTMIVCNDTRRINYYLSGWPSSAHDNRIFKNTDLYNLPESFFSNNEYILGDSAFENNWFIASCYKKPANTVLNWDQEIFNLAVSRANIAVEHTIGMLKGRFPWLRQIRAKLTEDVASMQQMLEYIDCCVILQTFYCSIKTMLFL